jgi:predicted RecB family nuclease
LLALFPLAHELRKVRFWFFTYTTAWEWAKPDAKRDSAMTSKITRGVLEGYLNCRYKGWLRLSGEQGHKSDYATLLTESNAQVRLAAIEKILVQHQDAQVARNVPLNTALLKRGMLVILDAILEDAVTCLFFDGLKQVQGPSRLGDHHYVPLLFYEGRQVRKEQTVLLQLYGHFLAGLQGQIPASGIIWHGKECKATRVRLPPDLPEAQQVLRGLRELETAESPPRLLLNDHCHICEFQQRCHAQAIAEDNLSLLRGMGEKEIRKYNRKGIFTTTQLSCTFRPRKRSKRVKTQAPIHYPSLQALAIRDAKTYVYGIPTLPKSKTQVYFDIEGDPERDFTYLLGAAIATPTEEKRYSFWADNPSQETQAFQQFLALLNGLDDFCIYHYGSYESMFLKRMRKQARKKMAVDKAIAASLNILSLLRSNVYFPTYSNGLKEIGAYLGCVWADTGATGIQSIVWRSKWERTHDDDLKRRLIQYNLDDCTALRKVTDFIYSIAAMGQEIGTEAHATSQPKIAWAHDIPMQSSRRELGKAKFFFPEFDYINKCAYFDYQREKVFLRTNERICRIRSTTSKKRGRVKLKGKRRIIIIRAAKCPFCKGTEIRRHGGRMHRKAGFDLRITRTGVARRVIECAAARHECKKCGRQFLPERYKRCDKHFHALKSWAMYQHVVHRISFQGLEAMLKECFDLEVGYPQLHMIKALMATRYQATYRGILKRIVLGNLIHADESHTNLQKGKGYVWVLTNLEEVVYLYKPSREGDFLHELLKGFNGVLVSDFYSAYDSLPCEQQKCLIHLIRDLNHDLLTHPYDEEFKSLVGEFGQLLRPIIATIDQVGLKKWHLQKHITDVSRFFEMVLGHHYKSEVAESYQERLAKNEGKLFTFLRHDGVPWNNNNAEHAVKCYAKYREVSDGKMTATGLTDYLVLLSIYQTCKYKGVSFLKFLLSQERDIDVFCTMKGRKCPESRVEVYPKGFPNLYKPKGRRAGPEKGT